MLRRALAFIGLGPILGYFYLRFVLPAGSAAPLDPHEIVLLPLIYFVGFLPATIAAGLDQILANKGVSWRPPVLSLGVFVIGFALAAPLMQLVGAAALALTVAVPALICSLLSGPSSLPGNSRRSSNPPTPAG